METLTKKTKGAIIGSVAGLTAIAVGVGIWQPWKKPEEEQLPILPPVEDVEEPQPPEEEPLTLSVGGEEIPCTLYEGDGWSIWVPEGWTVDDNGGNDEFPVCLAPAEETEGDVQLFVYYHMNDRMDGRRCAGIAGGRGSYLSRCFCVGTDDRFWYVEYHSEREVWADYEKLLAVVAGTFALDGKLVFDNLPWAWEPDWQEADGRTVLWLDKDGYIVDEDAERAVLEKMSSWSETARAPFTGRYRIEDLRWAGSYCTDPGAYQDVFEAQVWYELVPGREEEQTLTFDPIIQDGWLLDHWRLNLILDRDGERVSKVRAMWCIDEQAGRASFWEELESWDMAPVIGEELLYETEFPLTGAEILAARLYGRSPRAEVGTSAETSYGVSRVEVLRDGAVIQTISIADAIEAEAGELAITDGYTECPDPNGWLEAADLNGDGYTDLTLLEFLPAHNRPMLCWLWDRETERFRYAGCILDPEPGEAPGQVLSRSQDHAGAVRYIETYQIDENGRFQLAKRVTEDYTGDAKTPVVTEETFPTDRA